MFIFAHDKIGVFAEMGILAPIEELLPEGELSNYLGMTTEAATYKGTVYQLPLYFETLLFMYNRKYMTDDMVPSPRRSCTPTWRPTPAATATAL